MARDADDTRVAELRAELDARDQRIRTLERALEAMQASLSWRITAPVRALRTGLRRKAWARLLFERAMRLRYAWAARRGPARAPAPAGAILPADQVEAAKAVVKLHAELRLQAALRRGVPLRLPRAAEPAISILLVLYNQAALTWACLESIAAHADVPVEVIIVDNASSDDTDRLLALVADARVVRNADNVGFLKAVNQAAALARGRHLLLLNNDALLLPGALAAALDSMALPRVAAVGGKILLHHGRLQEAGSIVWADGTCQGYGRDRDPADPAVMARRDVDFCSGAFLLVDAEAFRALGGLDERYAPAYYEETDLCLRLWASGRRVVYDPRVEILHYEFASSANRAAALALQQRNQAVFRAAHAPALARQPPLDPDRQLWARARPPARGRLLILDARLPDPREGSGYPRAAAILQAAVDAGWAVTLYPLHRPSPAWPEVRRLVPLEVEVMTGLGVAGLGGFLAERRGYYDTVLVSRADCMAALSPHLARRAELLGTARLVYDAEALLALRAIQLATLSGQPPGEAEAKRLIAGEMALAARADAVLAVSEEEAGHYRAHGLPQVHVLGHELRPEPTTRPFADRDGLLFVGRLDEDDTPNVDSLVWFVEEILPVLEQRLGTAPRLTVAGSAAAPRLAQLRHPALQLLGRVDDLRPLYDRARVFIAPTRYAAGIPHKVHEAAAAGLPVVATPLLAQQLGWADGAELLVGGDPDAFAAACARLHEGEGLWQTIRERALSRIESDCAPAQFRATLDAALAPSA